MGAKQTKYSRYELYTPQVWLQEHMVPIEDICLVERSRIDQIRAERGFTSDQMSKAFCKVCLDKAILVCGSKVFDPRKDNSVLTVDFHGWLLFPAEREWTEDLAIATTESSSSRVTESKSCPVEDPSKAGLAPRLSQMLSARLSPRLSPRFRPPHPSLKLNLPGLRSSKSIERPKSESDPSPASLEELFKSSEPDKTKWEFPFRASRSDATTTSVPKGSGTSALKIATTSVARGVVLASPRHHASPRSVARSPESVPMGPTKSGKGHTIPKLRHSLLEVFNFENEDGHQRKFEIPIRVSSSIISLPAPGDNINLRAYCNYLSIEVRSEHGGDVLAGMWVPSDAILATVEAMLCKRLDALVVGLKG